MIKNSEYNSQEVFQIESAIETVNLIGWDSRLESATTAIWMLVTDIGNEMCKWQFKDVGDGFGHLA